MGRPTSEFVTERNQKLLLAFDSGVTSTLSLALQFDISETYVDLILRENGRIQNGTRRRRQTLDERRPLSNMTAALGFLIDETVNKAILEGRSVNNESLGFNAQRFSAMRRGLHPFNIIELEKIAAWMKIPVSQLMEQAEEKVAACSATGKSIGKSAG